MTTIKGHAFKPNEKQMAAERTARYKEIAHLRDNDIEISKSVQYGSNKFRGKLLTDEAKALSEFDIALIADHGNLCFGGNCVKTGDTFSGEYYTD